MTLNEQELKELRELLEAEKMTLEESLAAHGRKVGNDWSGTPKGFEEETDSEPEDAADRMEELATNVSLVEELERRYKDVTNALTRMDVGTYGLDVETNEPISIKRLRANPSAQRNI
ncbi:hypothetical protein A2673_00620 [Candidatus Kaiserbacteria bacterium RIFCSPHIGHO2_01_FULL_50_13]|uniref:Uncharacterized protein n=1 Tax=Candidatus Kaiserbacteria bacterium RIFCSPLOWO2_01_FULL_50_24 TaxID=1798507 RepID=A0A1F6ERI0_9BACT|nr:MAG: hypothetical protein A2673_00620 [Candidatus Kaiserbacteria bacterium RIFCSPHIGHO2_01_FULL_50_13]OGG76228.1 MAG: hypothetical protein A3A34_03270 [Candidatus Kaiserbacteria bacterium RIFCSPLOWO2_01_FULL_50_24]OGG81809.1 MAG: hypothetical protein A3H74_02650 [Candidatus Kaiserbacteria bacterium RIFCSPLOWO2_02_FULL_51_13]